MEAHVRRKSMTKPNTKRALARLERELRYVVDSQPGPQWERDLAHDRVSEALSAIRLIQFKVR